MESLRDDIDSKFHKCVSRALPIGILPPKIRGQKYVIGEGLEQLNHISTCFGLNRYILPI